LPSVHYHVSVAALDAQGHAGDSSGVWDFTWHPPAPGVPWPARPLPPATMFDEDLDPTALPAFFPRVQATLMHDANGIDPAYPVGIRIGELDPAWFPSPVPSTTNKVTYGVTSNIFGFNPMDAVFRRQSADPARHGEPLLPIVL